MTKEFQTWDWFIEQGHGTIVRINGKTEEWIRNLPDKVFTAQRIDENKIERGKDRIELRPEQKPARIMTKDEITGKFLELLLQEKEND